MRISMNKVLVIILLIFNFIPGITKEDKEYESIKIGNQIWMARNLDVDHYRNGDPIPEVTKSDDWFKINTGAWCYFNNDPANEKIYGKLYNWYTIKDPRGLAPEGWHVPSDSEWTVLEEYLGGSYIAGSKLMSMGTIEDGDGLWFRPNSGATNKNNFSALPGGWRYGNGTFGYIGYYAGWWSSTERPPSPPWFRLLGGSSGYFFRYNASITKQDGYSVRCIKD
jgi:uncharacterized protein (TIGR02145 family)